MKLAIAGTGQIVQTVFPYLKEWGWEPTALCATARSADLGRALAQQYGCPEVYTDYGDMLAKVDADAVYLGVPNFLHMEMGKQALEAGKNVIMEKPLASTIREAEILAALAREKGLYLC